MNMRIFLTGGTGFVGSEILRQLAAKGYSVRCLVRDEARLKVRTPSIEVIKGNILDVETYENALKDCSVVIHLVGIIREFKDKGITFHRLHFEATKNIVNAALRHDVKRFIHMSANGARPEAKSSYHRTKFLAEEYLKESGLSYTIFKPSIIFGKDDNFVNMIAGIMRISPIIPYFGKGDYRLQPISVKNVAEAFIKALEDPNTINKPYYLGGEKRYTYKKFLDVIAKTLNKRAIKISIPRVVIEKITALFGPYNWYPITSDQLIMLFEGNICENTNFYKELNIKPMDFEEGIREYLSPIPHLILSSGKLEVKS